ncbi:MAG: hypothetical protein R3B60_01620 [Candidatus Paceibacterota bacterium]
MQTKNNNSDTENTKNLKRGYLLVTVLVFGSIFFVIIVSFIGYIITQNHLINQKVQIQKAGDIAEAGLNYYKWYLAHYPDDTTNGTGLPGPYVHTYNDPEGGVIGEFSLAISSSTYCGDVASIDVYSTGISYEDPSVHKTIVAKYSRPTVAEYSFIINSNVWAGADRNIIGPYHSNGGIRMDGTNHSIVTSGQTSWNCTSSFGCSPDSTEDGVFTTVNGNASLFSFPSPPINFTGLTVNLSQMMDRAQNAGGTYIPPSSTYGYRITFNNNDTITVDEVTNTSQYWGYTSAGGWQLERNVISGTSFVGTYNISSDCPLIFVEDKVWLEGTVNGKVTLAAADVNTAGVDPSIVLNDHITYTSATSSGLLAIAEEDVLFGLTVPNNLVLNGIFIAQNGRVGRNHYSSAYLPGSLDPYVFRNSVTMTGTIVSNGRVGSQWTSGGIPISGFLNRQNNYDRNLVNAPPPLVPNTSDVFEITDWRDVK